MLDKSYDIQEWLDDPIGGTSEKLVCVLVFQDIESTL